MKKLIMFLVLVLVLASCNTVAGQAQFIPPSPAADSIQAPASVIDSSWKTYTNVEVGFSIRYPASWQEESLPDENAGQMHHIALKGTEGEVELIWGTGLGGACPDGYQPVAVANGTLPACHTQRADGADQWSLESQTIGNTGFTGNIFTNDTTASSREVVLKVISTLRFP